MKNPYDDDDLRAFVLNESKISTDDRELDERTPDLCCGMYENEITEPISDEPDEFSPEAVFASELELLRIHKRI